MTAITTTIGAGGASGNTCTSGSAGQINVWYWTA